MSINSTIQVSVEESAQKEAETIFKDLGISVSEAINIFFKKVIAEHGMPFEAKTPSAKLLEAIREAESKRGEYHEDIESLMKDLKS